MALLPACSLGTLLCVSSPCLTLQSHHLHLLQNHCDYTAKRFADEKSDRVRIFTNLGEQLDASVRTVGVHPLFACWLWWLADPIDCPTTPQFASANREEERVHTEMARHVADQKLDMVSSCLCALTRLQVPALLIWCTRNGRCCTGARECAA